MAIRPCIAATLATSDTGAVAGGINAARYVRETRSTLTNPASSVAAPGAVEADPLRAPHRAQRQDAVGRLDGVPVGQGDSDAVAVARQDSIRERASASMPRRSRTSSSTPAASASSPGSTWSRLDTRVTREPGRGRAGELGAGDARADHDQVARQLGQGGCDLLPGQDPLTVEHAVHHLLLQPHRRCLSAASESELHRGSNATPLFATPAGGAARSRRRFAIPGNATRLISTSSRSATAGIAGAPPSVDAHRGSVSKPGTAPATSARACQLPRCHGRPASAPARGIERDAARVFRQLQTSSVSARAPPPDSVVVERDHVAAE